MFKQYIYFLILSISLLNSHAMASSEILYLIKFNPQIEQCLDITATIPSTSKNEYIIHFPQYGISSLEINPAFSQAIEIAPFTKRIILTTPGDLTLRYQLCSENSKHQIDLPIIEKNFMQLTAINALPLPMHRDDSNIQIELIDVPKNLTLLSSEGKVTFNKISFHGLIDEFSTLVIAGGTQVKEFNIGQRAVFALSTHQTIPFPDERIAKIKK